MPYYINKKGGPAGAITAIKKGALVWNKVGGSAFKFLYRGKTGNTGLGTLDYVNVVSFGLLDLGYIGLNAYWFSRYQLNQCPG